MPASPQTFKSLLITQSIAVVGFLVIPAAVTFIAPRTTIELQRVEGNTSATVTKHILLFVPCSKTTIKSVEDVEAEVTASKRGYSTRSDRRKNRKVYQAGDGSIWIRGGESECQVQSNPTDAPLQAAQIKTFLDDPAAERLFLTSTAGWAFTYLLGGVMTGLSVLYLVGATLAVGRWLLNRTLMARSSE